MSPDRVPREKALFQLLLKGSSRDWYRALRTRSKIPAHIAIVNGKVVHRTSVEHPPSVHSHKLVTLYFYDH
jgi:hypothetical protein